MGYKFEKYSAGGGGTGSGIIEVDELPTENIDENAVYRVNGYSDVGVYLHTGSVFDLANPFENILTDANPNAIVAYYVVDSLPENPEPSDFATLSTVTVYIWNDTPYVFCNMGAGETWLLLSAVLNAMLAQMGVTVEYADKGYIYNPNKINEMGLYVTYAYNSTAECIETDKVYYRGEWIKLDELLSIDHIFRVKEVTAEDLRGLEGIYKYMFYRCTDTDKTANSARFNNFYSLLEKITLPDNIKYISDYGFFGCRSLTTINSDNNIEFIGEYAFIACAIKEMSFPKIKKLWDGALYESSELETLSLGGDLEYIGRQALHCPKLTTINYNGTKEQWKAVEKVGDWDYGLLNYTIYCTDGTIAKDGTET